ncbi:MAG TPA: DUF6318 family protein [Actinomycetaceae bacterium]|nr:DUF6318 family protein [Actinomycetaceae bacterium]
MLGLIVAGLLLVACTTDSEPTPLDPTPAPTAAPATPTEEPSSPEPTSEPGPGPTPWPEPTKPAAMDRDDIEGAIAAAEYFLALYPYVYATGDLDAWREMSHPECVFCQSTVDNVTQIYADGGYALGSEFTVEDVGASPPDDEYAHYRIGIYGSEAPGAVYSTDGKVISRTDGGTGAYHFGVLRADQSWQIRGVFGEDEEK